MSDSLLIVGIAVALFALVVILDNRRHLASTHHEDEE